MAQLTVTDVTKEKDWYPCFKTVIKMTAEEFAKLPGCFESAKKLKDGTYKFSSTSQTTGRNPTVDEVTKQKAKLLAYFGVVA